MFKKLTVCFALTTISSFMFAGESLEVSLKELISKPENYLNKVVKTVGTVDHVCKHGGKKMLVFADTPQESIHVMSSETVPVFEAEISGSDVTIIGTVKENRITKAQVLKMKAEREEAAAKENAKPSVKKGEGPGHGLGKHDHDHDHDHDGGHEDNLTKILKEMDASGKDYVSDYYIECIEYSVNQ
ncbi:MAG: hypothetical protein CSA81_10130 [Acidobacteria bacterium]|nr:MAG: hypothetical protein CSA81_10130 [Acidobacteriota bacterium]